MKIKYKMCLSILLISLIWVGNVNRVGVNSGWDAREEEKFLESVALPPTDARVFYLIDSVNDLGYPGDLNFDAHEIANRFSLKTLNGHSGLVPRGYRIWYKEEGIVGVSEWIKKNNLENVYVYDKGRNIWFLHQSH